MAETPKPTCPFCNAPWTEQMLEQLELHSGDAFCACCVGVPREGHPVPRTVPARDLCCEACGRPIYRAPAAARATLPGLG